MNSLTLTIEDRLTIARERIAAYHELSKPRVLTMILIAALAGFYMGAGSNFPIGAALWMLLGVTLAAGGTLALNQYFERDTDALMVRTRYRPVPSGRIAPAEALLFGAIATLGGVVLLWTLINPLAAAVTAAITILYLAAYTPLKRYSWICHLVGAVPGALPPVIGWAAARGTLSFEPFTIFGIMFLWQLPHSLSIARLYQDDYARAGLSLLPRDRNWGNPASLLILIATACLTLFGVVPAWMGFAGRVYLLLSIALGATMLYYAIALIRGAVGPRRVMFVSLIYLPIVLLSMVLDRV